MYNEEKRDDRGIRLDVYAEDNENQIFDIEMQTTRQKNLSKRSRYYQGMMDLDLINRGADFRELKKSYVIFICMNDPFPKHVRHIYSLKMMC
jgi:predicted transposase/invertase (TIGR01784 family)